MSDICCVTGTIVAKVIQAGRHVNKHEWTPQLILIPTYTKQMEGVQIVCTECETKTKTNKQKCISNARKPF